MSEIVFSKAVRENTAIVLALCGGSGSGKTKSALELAAGLAYRNGKILMIDSEGARGKHYADEYEFLHFDWQAPYTPASLGRLLQAAADQRIAVVIVDSMSSEHEDQGGLVDMAEAEYEKQRGESKNSAAAWARPKAEHKHHIVRWLRTARCHVIFCCRASEKVKFERVERNGRMTTQIVPIGWQPICEKNLLYDVTTSLLFTPDHPGVPTPIKLYDKHAPFFPPNKPITREAGRRLAEWAAGGAARTDHPGAASPHPAPSAPTGKESHEVDTAHSQPATEPPQGADANSGRKAFVWLGAAIRAANTKEALAELDPRLIEEQCNHAWRKLREAHTPSWDNRVALWHERWAALATEGTADV